MPAPFVAGAIALGARALPILSRLIFPSAAAQTIINTADPAALANGEAPTKLGHTPFQLSSHTPTMADILNPRALPTPEAPPRTCNTWEPFK